MKFLRNFLDKQRPHFEKGGKLSSLFVVYELIDTFMYTPGEVTKSASHIRDALDLKRLMILVAFALTPAVLMGSYNVGLQANLALNGATPEGWRAAIMTSLGLGFDSNSVVDCFVYGFLYFLPLYLVSNLVGGIWEAIFAQVRGHEINEGFLITGIIYPLILPATIPLWQAALGISFAVVIGKEVFGGTGMNVFNPALVGRAFLFFAYPAQMSGNAVWVVFDGHTSATAADGYTAATAMGDAAESGVANIGIDWWDAFWGFIPGSIGETSTAAILLGAAILIVSNVASWRIMLSIVISMFIMSTVFNSIGSETNHMFNMGPEWHLVLGGFAFGTVFMATDPVSAAMTDTGKIIYGALIGLLVVLVRVVNPAFPEGMMLAILFGNAFAPLIDNYVVKQNIKRRAARYVA